MGTQTKPGQPEPSTPLLAGLVAVLIGGSLLAGVTWLVITYDAASYVIVAALSCIAALAVVALCLWLAVKGNWRARVLAAALAAGLALLVLWAVGQ